MPHNVNWQNVRNRMKTPDEDNQQTHGANQTGGNNPTVETGRTDNVTTPVNEAPPAVDVVEPAPTPAPDSVTPPTQPTAPVTPRPQISISSTKMPYRVPAGLDQILGAEAKKFYGSLEDMTQADVVRQVARLAADAPVQMAFGGVFKDNAGQFLMAHHAAKAIMGLFSKTAAQGGNAAGWQALVGAGIIAEADVASMGGPEGTPNIEASKLKPEQISKVISNPQLCQTAELYRALDFDFDFVIGKHMTGGPDGSMKAPQIIICGPKDKGYPGMSALVHDIEKAEPGAVFGTQKCHMSQCHVEGPLGAQLEDTDLASTHRGATWAVVDKHGNKLLAAIDWPIGYQATYPSGTAEYQQNLRVFSPYKLTYTKPLPMEKADYVKLCSDVGKAVSVLAQARTPFASGSAFNFDTSYFVNSLGIQKGDDVAKFAYLTAKPETQFQVTFGDRSASVPAKEMGKFTSLYCAEGSEAVQAFVLNYRPDANYREMAKIFNQAVKADMESRTAAGEQKVLADNTKGWDALQGAGFLSSEERARLNSTNAALTPFPEIPAGIDYKPLVDFGPKELDLSDKVGGKLSKLPIGVPEMTMGAFRVLAPRARIAEKIAEHLAGKMRGEAGQKVKLQAAAFLQEQAQKTKDKAEAAGVQMAFPEMDLSSPEAIAQKFGEWYAASQQAGALASGGLKSALLKQVRYEFMDEASKKLIDNMLGVYALLTSNFTLSQEELYKGLTEYNDTLRDKEVVMNYPSPFPGEEGRTVQVRENIMVYLPPHFELIQDHLLGVRGFRSAEQFIGRVLPDGFAKPELKAVIDAMPAVDLS